ncbi:MAG: hypothetical protein IK081_11480 [Lachnospiraceae bacterium]|nr:hypothetical protein [Lachnospiraceae bacterium]
MEKARIQELRQFLGKMEITAAILCVPLLFMRRGEGISAILAAMATCIVLFIVTKACSKPERNIPFEREEVVKVAIGLIALSVGFFVMEEALFPAIIFLAIALFLLLEFVSYLYKRKSSIYDSLPQNIRLLDYVFPADDVYLDAEAEYLRLQGKGSEAELTEEERDKIRRYAATPLSYLMGWLLERGLLTEKYARHLRETADKAWENVKSGALTPLDALILAEYYFSMDFVKAEARGFVLDYFVDNGQFFGEDAFVYDFCECKEDLNGSYYCTEYSRDVQKRLSQRIGECFERYQFNAEQYRTAAKFYKNVPFEKEKRAYSHRHHAELGVYKSGMKLKGTFPEGYVDKCVKMLDQGIAPGEWERLERWLKEGYLRDEKEKADVLSRFTAKALYAFEPMTEGDVAFVVAGSLDFEAAKEHGLSYTVRNGLILNWGYANGFGDAYGLEASLEYVRLLQGSKFFEVREEQDAKGLAEQGKLVKTWLVPESLGGTDEEENVIYLTQEALEKKEKYERWLRYLKIYAASKREGWELNFHYQAKWLTGESGERESLVPVSILIDNQGDGSSFTIRFQVKIWE